jgi:hypothetical protein
MTVRRTASPGKLAAFVRTLRDNGLRRRAGGGPGCAALIAAGYRRKPVLLRRRSSICSLRARRIGTSFDGLFDAFWLRQAT